MRKSQCGLHGKCLRSNSRERASERILKAGVHAKESPGDTHGRCFLSRGFSTTKFHFAMHRVTFKSPEAMENSKKALSALQGARRGTSAESKVELSIAGTQHSGLPAVPLVKQLCAGIPGLREIVLFVKRPRQLLACSVCGPQHHISSSLETPDILEFLNFRKCFKEYQERENPATRPFEIVWTELSVVTFWVRTSVSVFCKRIFVPRKNVRALSARTDYLIPSSDQKKNLASIFEAYLIGPQRWTLIRALSGYQHLWARISDERINTLSTYARVHALLRFPQYITLWNFEKFVMEIGDRFKSRHEISE